MERLSSKASDDATADTVRKDVEKQDNNLEITPTTQPPSPNIAEISNFKSCLQCLGAFFLFFNSWGLVNAFGAWEEFYVHSSLLHVSSSSRISWIGSLQAFLFLFGGVLAGPLYDRGHLMPLICTGSFLIVLGMMMTSLCSEYWQVVIAQGLVIGAGNGCLFIPSTAIIPPYFPKKGALAMGIALTGGNIGGIIYSSVFERLQPSIGFPWATRIIGFIELATLIVPITVLRMRFKPTQTRRLFDAVAWKEPRYSLFAFANLMGFIGLYIPWFYANNWAVSNKVVDTKLAVYLVSILNAGSFIGRITLTYAADLFGPLNMLLICFLGSSVLAFAWIGISSTTGAIIFCLLYGCFSGALISISLTVIAAVLCPEIRSLGVRIGMICITCSIGILFGSPLGGLVLHNGWESLQIFAAAMLIAGGINIVVIRFLTAGVHPMVKC